MYSGTSLMICKSEFQSISFLILLRMYMQKGLVLCPKSLERDFLPREAMTQNGSYGHWMAMQVGLREIRGELKNKLT